MMQQNLETKYAKISYKAPSNIAFVKYWGKRDRQIPMNPSLSMTLSECYSEISISFRKESSLYNIKKFEFEGKENTLFKERFEKYLNSIVDLLPWLKNYSLEIKSQNSFPHSTGIASSASSFAALGLCLEHFDSHLNGRDINLRKASELARLGSGSASRSIFGPFVSWGEDSHVAHSSNSYASMVKNISSKFNNLQDSILIVSSKEKEVGSSAGHALMHGHLFNEVRYIQACDNLKNLVIAMNAGDIEGFGSILESEALTLHALMMTSDPSYLLLEGNSLFILDEVRKFRKQTKIPVYFTIDAGPNIHLIYPGEYRNQVNTFIDQNLKKYCENGKVIHDHVGAGAELIEVLYE